MSSHIEGILRSGTVLLETMDRFYKIILPPEVEKSGEAEIKCYLIKWMQKNIGYNVKVCFWRYVGCEIRAYIPMGEKIVTRTYAGREITSIMQDIHGMTPLRYHSIIQVYNQIVVAQAILYS